MTLKRLILVLLTVLAVFLTVSSLYNSWSQPQFQSRLELYQTNLLLDAVEWQGETLADDHVKSTREVLLGADPLKSALKQYREVRETAEKNLAKTRTRLEAVQAVETTPVAQQTVEAQLHKAIDQIEASLDELDLRLGVLQTQTNQTAAALQTWQNLEVRSPNSSIPEIGATAQVLSGLWSEPARLLPDAEETLQGQLRGWFRYQALSRLYQIQQRTEALAKLQANQQEVAEQAVIKLALAGGIQAIGGFLGIILLIGLIVQRFLKGKESLWAKNEGMPWQTPWNWEVILQVLVFGFFFVGQILLGRFLLPIALGVLRINPAAAEVRLQAIYILVSYILLMVGGLGILYLSVKPFKPLPEGWFNFNFTGNWIGWGFGGFLAALPLVVLVSLINQKLWQGQGGSNPILPIALSGRDPVAIAIFFLTASVAAPVFEETIFRGFFLPSLTRYIPVWGAIVVSAFVFAVAHLSLSEVLPLMTLGIILGFVYSRTRNLLAPIFMHSLWNGSTLLSLFLLGGSGG